MCIRVLFSLLETLWRENNQMFLHEAKQTLWTILLLCPCGPENSKKNGQLTSMYSNVQLLCLLLFFADAVAFLIA